MRKETESGFTLIEILVVIGIIAIITAIAIPVFLHQRKSSAKASIESDLKNAAIVMQDEMVANKGKFQPYVPNYDNRSEGVEVNLNKAMSSSNKICLIGKSTTYPDIILSYDSLQGGILPQGQSCTQPDGSTGNESFSSALASKKALIVYGPNGHDLQVQTYLKTQYGFGTVDIMANPDPSVYASYDVIVAAGRGWAIPSGVYANLLVGYENGAKILMDGNDSGPTHLPKFIHTASLRNGGTTYFNQTGNTGLTPAFPYTYAHTSHPGDSNWICVLTAKPEVTTIANTPDPNNPSNKCITALGISEGNGQWIYLNYMPTGSSGGMTDAALNWLVY